MRTGRRQKYSEYSDGQLRIDWDCMLKDILKHWWMILISAVAAAFFVGAVVQMRYVPVYTAQTTFVIGKSGFSYNSVYNNLNQAETTTQQYAQVVNSSILRRQVCEDLGLSGFPAQVSVETIPSSNLMVLSVSAASPRQAYLVSRSVIEQALELMGYFMDGVMMQELQSAVIPEEPSNPLDIVSYMQKAAIGGFLIMVVILALLSCYKDTIKNVGDVSRKVDAKLLGTIDFEKRNKSLVAKRGHKRISMLINNPMLSFGYVESYRMLATRVRMAMDRNKMRVLMVTSVSENEGKSTVAANIAVAMAQEGKKVLIVDCDFRKPAQYKIFEVDCPEDRDFCVAVMKKSNVKVGHVRNFPGLFTLFCKKTKGSSWDGEAIAYISHVLNYLKDKVDYIILDTSPMAFVSDTEEYAGLADGSLLVIRQDVMEACYINDAVDNLENAGTPLIGCVFNGVHRGVVEKTRNYGHYGGSNYGRYSHYGKVKERAGE